MPCVGQVVAGGRLLQGPLTAGSSCRTRPSSRSTLAPVPAHFVHLQAGAAQGSRELSPSPHSYGTLIRAQALATRAAHGAGAASGALRLDGWACHSPSAPSSPSVRDGPVRCPSSVTFEWSRSAGFRELRRVLGPAPALPAPGKHVQPSHGAFVPSQSVGREGTQGRVTCQTALEKSLCKIYDYSY